MMSARATQTHHHSWPVDTSTRQVTQIIGGEQMPVGETELLANVCDVEVLVILLCDHLKPIKVIDALVQRLRVLAASWSMRFIWPRGSRKNTSRQQVLSYIQESNDQQGRKRDDHCANAELMHQR